MKLNVPESIRWVDNCLFLLDQTKLPGEVVEEKQETIGMVWHAIKQLKVRGAPAIGIAAVYGLLVGIKESLNLPMDGFKAVLKKQAAYLDSARPTAVNLHWSMVRMLNKAESLSVETPQEIYDALVEEAKAIDNEDKQLCLGMGTHGAPLIKENMGILTHCNAGALATCAFGETGQAKVPFRPVEITANDKPAITKNRN